MSNIYYGKGAFTGSFVGMKKEKSIPTPPPPPIKDEPQVAIPVPVDDTPEEEPVYIPIGQNQQTGGIISVPEDELYAGTYIVGSSGTGKTTICSTIALHQIEAGDSVIVLDPTPGGDMIRDILARMDRGKLKDAFLFSLSEFKWPFSLPVFSYTIPKDNRGYEEEQATKQRIVSAFEHLWHEIKPQVYIKKMLRNIIPILLEHPHFTLAHIPDFFSDKAFRLKVVRGIKNEQVKRFWREYETWSQDRKDLETESFRTRVDDLLEDGYSKYILCQKQRVEGKRPISISALIARKKIVFVHLPLNREAYRKAAKTIGIFFMMLITTAIFEAGTKGREKRPTVTILVDEFAKWAVGSAEEFEQILSYGRKNKVRLVCCHQYLGQFDEEEKI